MAKIEIEPKMSDLMALDHRVAMFSTQPLHHNQQQQQQHAAS